MRKILIAFTEKQYKRLHLEKQKTGNSIASIIRNVIEQYFLKKKEEGAGIFVKKKK